MFRKAQDARNIFCGSSYLFTQKKFVSLWLASSPSTLLCFTVHWNRFGEKQNSKFSKKRHFDVWRTISAVDKSSSECNLLQTLGKWRSVWVSRSLLNSVNSVYPSSIEHLKFAGNRRNFRKPISMMKRLKFTRTDARKTVRGTVYVN